MGIITSLVTGRPIGATYGPFDNFWYTADPRDSQTASGYPVSPETSMRLGAVFACVGLISDMVGSLPLIVYRRLDDEGKERATTHPLYNLLRRQPNQRQTAKEWRTMGTAHLLLRGNFYNRIVLDGRGAIIGLEPLHPDLVDVTLLESGRRGYLYRPPGKPPRPFTQDEIFHVMGLTLDGITGVSVIEYARNSIGTSLAQDAFAGNFWRDGAEPRSILTHKGPGKLTDENMQNLQRTWAERAGKLAILQGGLEHTPVGVSNHDAQFVESRRFSVSDIARFFRVPPHMIGDVTGTTSWGSGIFELSLGFVNFTLNPWLVSYEQAIDRDLIEDPTSSLFAEFIVDALLRGNPEARATSHRQYVDGGIKSVNEVRIIENLNPLEGDEFDKPHRAGNMGGEPGGGDPETTRKVETPRRLTRVPDDDDEEDEAARAKAQRITLASAERLVRKEVSTVRKLAARYAARDVAEWRKRTATFYGEHAGDLESALAMGTQAARAYCADHCGRMIANGGAISDEYEREQPAVLAALAMEGAGG